MLASLQWKHTPSLRGLTLLWFFSLFEDWRLIFGCEEQKYFHPSLSLQNATMTATQKEPRKSRLHRSSTFSLALDRTQTYCNLFPTAGLRCHSQPVPGRYVTQKK